jgi:3-methyladenine DNA glycosylase Mpg
MSISSTACIIVLAFLVYRKAWQGEFSFGRLACLGLGTMASLRGVLSNAKSRMLTGGPGRLCQAIGITRAIGNGLNVTRSRSMLQIADDGNRPDEIEIIPRIGIRKAVDRPCVSW